MAKSVQGETQLSNKQHVTDDGPGMDQMTPKVSKPKRCPTQTIGIPAETPIVTGRLRPRKPQFILETTSPIARHQAWRRRTPSIANSESEEESEEKSEQESEGEESEGTAIGSADDEDEYEEELKHGEKTNSNESIDVKDRDIQMIDLADMPVGVSGGANTARFINKRKLSEHDNDIEDVRPDSSILHIPPAPKRTANGEIIDPRIFDGALQLINGIWMVPCTCNACPVSARCRGYRLSESGTSTPNPIPAPAANSGKAHADLLGTGNGNISKKPKEIPSIAH